MRKIYRALLTGTTAGFFLIAAAHAQSQAAPDPQTTPRPATPPAMPAPETAPTPAPAPAAPEAQAPESASPLVTATEAAKQWLTLTDTGKFAESWTAGGKLFQANVTQDKWAAAMTAGRVPLGQVTSRELAERKAMEQVAGAPAGEYIVVAFFTDFENRSGLLETITLNLEEGGQWKVVGYNIQPKPEPKTETPATGETPPSNPPAAETPPPSS